jgi:N-acetylglucosaminyl-diphospho-decaprenol L-rhamnosyltransferase
MSELGVVVLAYGAGGEYLKVVQALEDQGSALGRRVIVHNPSAPDEELPAPPADWQLIRASHNLGYAAGMNLGIGRLLEVPSVDLVLLLTHDASLRPGALGRLLAAADGPRTGALGPSLQFADGVKPFSYGGTMSTAGTLGHRKQRPSAPDGIAVCDWIDGGTMLVGSAALRAVGDFDERLWSYCEDADLCLRLSREGFVVAVVLDAVADQSPGAAKRPGPWAYLRARNGLAVARRRAGWRGVAAGLLSWGGLMLSELARTLARLSGMRPGSPAATWPVAVGTARGIVDFLRGRWGPPPPLPGGGDMANLTPPGGRRE